jgi:hypothetical protein
MSGGDQGIEGHGFTFTIGATRAKVDAAGS